MNVKKVIRKTMKVLAAVTASLLAVVLIVLALLLVRPVREKLLDMVVSKVQKSIPGEISLSDARWPSLGVLEIDGAVWIDGGDTLAAVGGLSISADLSELFRKDVHVREVTVSDISGDIPAITARFSTPDDGNRSGGGFPRTGSLPGIPSIAIDRIEIEGQRILISEGIELIGLKLRCGLDLLHGSEPFVSIEELTLERPSSPVSTDSLWLRADLAEPSLEGEGIILLPHDIDVHLICQAGQDGSFTVRIVPADGPLTSTDAFVSIGGTATIEGRRLASVDFEAEFLTPGTEELAAVPFLAGALKSIGDLEGVRGGLKGHLDLSPALSASADLHLNRTSYLDTLHLAGAYSTDTISVDGILLEMPGLMVDASGSLTGRSPVLSAYVRVDSMTWLTGIMPDMAFPGGITAELTLETDEREGPDGIPLRLMGRAAAGGTSIDSIHVSGIIPKGENQPYEADLIVDTYGIRIMTTAIADLSSGIELTLTGPAEERPDTGTVYLAGGIRIDDMTGDITINDLHTEGIFGRISISAEIDSTRRGRFDILGQWPEPPAALRTAVSADSAVWDSLVTLWLANGPFELRIDGNLSGGGNGISATGSALLPGPRLFAPLIAEGSVLSDLGPLILDFRGSFAAEDSGRSIEGHIDLGRTEWIDTALVAVAGSGDSMTVDTMLLVFEGLRISAGGGIAGEILNLDAAVSLADSLLVQRLGRLAGRNMSMTFDARCALSGTKADPAVSIGIDGRMSTEGLTIPRYAGTVERDGGITRADLSLPEGLIAKIIRFDTITASYRDDANVADSSGASVRLAAVGRDTEILFAFHVPSRDGFSVLADTLFTAVSGQTLASKTPFEVSTLEGGGIRIDNLFLDGSIGSIRADGIASPDSADLETHIQIVVPDKPEVIEIADRLWPDSITIDARANGPSQISVDGRISGVTTGDGTKTDIEFNLTADKNALKSSLHITGPERTIYSFDGTFPPLQSDGHVADGPLRLDVVLDKAPVPGELKAFVAEEPQQIGLLSGRIAARGTLSDPEAVILLDCSFIEGKELEKYILSIDGKYAREEVSDTTLKRLVNSRKAGGSGAAAAKGTTGLSADLTLTKSGQPVFTGNIEYPLQVTLVPLTFDRSESGEMLLEVVLEKLALTDLDPLLPPDIDLEGSVEFDLKAEGKVGNPRVAGHLETKGMSLAVASDLQASPTVNLEFGGDLARPSVKGSIVIERALLRIPERMENLHDVEGESILREVADSFRVATDTTLAAAEDTLLLDEPEILKGMDLDVTITIPNSFRIESERLSLELEGTLRIRQQGDRPIITGELKPRKGRLAFMGRYFEIQRGSVFFYGGDEMNPSFDLTLKARVSEYDISIKLTGTALEPEIELTSNPARSESDIMSLLLFGRTMSDLDSSQSNLLQQRTSEILMVFGAIKLEGEMSKRLGVDMFTFQQSTRDPNETALMVGKYINNKTMLKYEQGLENTANFLINLEYQLSRRFKVETFIDQKSETGLELNWSNEY